MQKKLQLAFAAALLSSTSLSNAYAQDTVSSVDEVTVYATRSTQSTFDVPAMVSKIDVDAPENATAGTISQLLNHVPGVSVGNGPRRSAQVVSLRGFDSEAILTLIDNRRQNFESGHDGRFFIDPSLLKSVDIVKGGASAIYGGGAVGGVIAFETKDASDLLKPGETFGAMSSLGYRSGAGEFSTTQSAYGRMGDMDLLGSLNYRKAGDIQMGAKSHKFEGTNDLPARDRIYSGLLKAGYTFNDFHTLKLNAQKLNQDSEEPSTNTSTSKTYVDKQIDDLQLGIKYTYENPDDTWLNPSLHIYRNRSEVEETDLSGSNKARVKLRQMTTLGTTLDNQSKFNVSENQKHTLSYGGEYYTDTQVGKSTSTAFGGVPNADASNLGFYLQDNVEFNTSIGDFSIIPAARFDRNKSNDENGNSQNESAVSPKLSLSYKPTDQYLLFGNWSRAFRAPNLTEIYADGQHYPGNNFLTNTDLKPETVTTIELGAGIDFKNVLSENDHLKVKGSIFRSRGKDFIDQRFNSSYTTTQYYNVAKATLKGWEVDASYDFASFTTTAGLSYVRARNNEDNTYLESSEPLTLSTGLSYDVDSMDSVIGWNAKFVRQAHETTTASSRKDAYATHDIFYRYMPNDDLFIDLGIDNVFDEGYQTSSALYEEGRSFVGKVTYKW